MVEPGLVTVAPLHLVVVVVDVVAAAPAVAAVQAVLQGAQTVMLRALVRTVVGGTGEIEVIVASALAAVAGLEEANEAVAAAGLKPSRLNE